MKENLGLRILALVLAIVLWAFVRVTQEPLNSEALAQVTLELPLQLQGTPPDLVAYEGSSEKVSVSLKGPAEVVNTLREGLVRTYVELSGMAPGSHWPEVKVVAPGGVQVLEVKPPSVNVKLSPIATAQVPVKILVTGKPAQGMKAQQPAVEPSSVKIQGPEALVREVAAVVGTVVLEGQSQAYSIDVAGLTPVTTNNVPVRTASFQLRVVPKEVAVTVPISSEGQTVGVPIIADYKLPSRLKYYNVTWHPENATVVVPTNSQAPKALYTRPVDFSSAADSTTREVRLEIPKGVDVLDPQAVTVKLEVLEEAPSSSADAE